MHVKYSCIYTHTTCTHPPTHTHTLCTGPSSWLGVCKSLTELFAHCLAQGRLQGVPPATGSHAAGAPIHPSSSSDVDVSGNTTTNIPSSTTLDNSTTTTTTTTHTEGILPHLHEGPTRDVGSLLLLQLVDPSTSTLGGAELRVMLLVVGRIAMLGHLNLRCVLRWGRGMGVGLCEGAGACNDRQRVWDVVHMHLNIHPHPHIPITHTTGCLV